MAIPETMRAMVLDGPRKPLRATELPVPEPGPGQVLLKVLACGVCRTDLHLLDGEVDVPEPPRVLGHQIVGELVAGELPEGASPGGLLGVPWLGWTDGVCEYCRSGRENLCPNARFTGRDIDGGYAEYTLADARFTLPLPPSFEPLDVAPLLCAGLIGYRALRMCGDAPPGPAPPRSGHPRSSTRRSSSRPSARSCRWRSKRWLPGASSSAAAST